MKALSPQIKILHIYYQITKISFRLKISSLFFAKLDFNAKDESQKEWMK